MNLHRTVLLTRSFLLTLVASCVVGCAVDRTPIPYGVIPHQDALDNQEEQYGQQVLNQLTQQFPLSRDYSAINRVQNVVDKLTAAAGADRNPWHVYVLEDRSFKNAAATRGNYVFVWTAMLDETKTDAELATVLAHEIGHVLAGHTMPTPGEEANEIMAGTAGQIAGQVLQSQGGAYGLAAGIAGSLVEEGIKAFIVNPEQQRKELEADHIGLFLMADAGYQPQEAVSFWKRVSSDPSFGGPSSLAFLSSHPSSDDRYRQLDQLLPDAELRYRAAKSGDSFNVANHKGGPRRPFAVSSAPEKTNDRDRTNDRNGRDSAPSVPPPMPRNEWVATGNDRPREFAQPRRGRPERWIVVEPTTEIFASPAQGAAHIGTLKVGDVVTVLGTGGGWLEISAPSRGFVRGRDLSPE